MKNDLFDVSKMIKVGGKLIRLNRKHRNANYIDDMVMLNKRGAKDTGFAAVDFYRLNKITGWKQQETSRFIFDILNFVQLKKWLYFCIYFFSYFGSKKSTYFIFFYFSLVNIYLSLHFFSIGMNYVEIKLYFLKRRRYKKKLYLKIY